MDGGLRIATIVGARPQFIKAAAVSRAIADHNRGASGVRPVEEVLIHTGQHYDDNMSRVFFEELHIPRPRYNLDVGSGSHGRQTAAMLERLEPLLRDERPDGVLLYGDTNSTLAGALAAAKLNLPVAHVEAGLRSFNRRMPEEINRIMADRVAGLLFCPTQTAVANLAREGVTEGVHRTGDVMYDSVLFNAELAGQRSRILATLSLAPKSYLLATVHRAENTDDPRRLAGIVEAFAEIDRPIVLPLHPRTRHLLDCARSRGVGRGKTLDTMSHVRVIEPVGYLDMLTLERNARAILTDSGGMQKEAYWFGVPCVTLRDETEWVELVEVGANRLAGADRGRIVAAVAWAMADCKPAATEPLYGDGHAAGEIVRLLAASFGGGFRGQTRPAPSRSRF